MLPHSLKAYLQNKRGYSITSAARISGGSINKAAKITIEEMGGCFLKWNRTADPDMFVKEVKGLEILKNAGTELVVPKPYGHGVDREGIGYLLMEFIEEGSPREDSHSTFGAQLAALHKVTDDHYGLDHHNYIGKLPQSNTQHSDWISFFIEERMEPQLEMAVNSGKLSPSTINTFNKLYQRLPELMPEEPPSLLHGDLWGGNYFYNMNGRATIYDPAVYYGHREMELAFTYLFGGFSSEFYSSYRESYPIAPKFNARRDLYNLYPLLVHTNLFGGHYARQVQSTVNKFS